MYFASMGADMNMLDNEGRSPLNIAIRRGHLESVSVLAQVIVLNVGDSLSVADLRLPGWLL